jgi:catechol 2,3-dioxygenase-like lactoylglutathione lyase family enzyme
MIGYITIGTNDLARAAKFYDAVLGEMGAKQQWSNERMVSWGAAPRTPSVIVTKPYDGQDAYHGNGTMVALLASSPEVVGRVYQKALSLGAKDEGAPGYRGPEAQGFYGAYFRDLDGNKFAAFCMAPKK